MQDVLAQIDEEIAKLQQARALLAGTPEAPVDAIVGGKKSWSRTPQRQQERRRSRTRRSSQEGQASVEPGGS